MHPYGVGAHCKRNGILHTNLHTGCPVSWASLPENIKRAAEENLSHEQLEAYRLWEDGLGYRNIAAMLNISVSSARDRIHRAIRNLEPHIEAAQ